jgi:hypothetical protein
MTTNVIKKKNNMCISKYYFGLQGSCNRNTFDDIKHEQKVEIFYKDNLGSNWYGTFFKYIIGIPTWNGKKHPPCWD